MSIPEQTGDAPVGTTTTDGSHAEPPTSLDSHPLPLLDRQLQVHALRSRHPAPPVLLRIPGSGDTSGAAVISAVDGGRAHHECDGAVEPNRYAVRVRRRRHVGWSARTVLRAVVGGGSAEVFV